MATLQWLHVLVLKFACLYNECCKTRSCVVNINTILKFQSTGTLLPRTRDGPLTAVQYRSYGVYGSTCRPSCHSNRMSTTIMWRLYQYFAAAVSRKNYKRDFFVIFSWKPRWKDFLLKATKSRMTSRDICWCLVVMATRSARRPVDAVDRYWTALRSRVTSDIFGAYVSNILCKQTCLRTNFRALRVMMGIGCVPRLGLAAWDWALAAVDSRYLEDWLIIVYNANRTIRNRLVRDLLYSLIGNPNLCLETLYVNVVQSRYLPRASAVGESPFSFLWTPWWFDRLRLVVLCY